MLDEFLSKQTQTVILVYPHLITPQEENKLHVCCNVSVQTETHFDVDQPEDEIEDLLIYIPISDIERDFLRIIEIPKKIILTFNEQIAAQSLDEVTSHEFYEISSTVALHPTGKSSLKHCKEAMAHNVNANTQTHLIVRPYILDLNEVAQVYCNVHAQTSTTFTPNASMEQVAHNLNKYHGHQHPSHQSTRPSNVDEGNMDDVQNIIQNDQESTQSATESYDGDAAEGKEISPEDALRKKKLKKGLKNRLTARDIENICKGCSTEESVLIKIREWYKEIQALVDAESEDEVQDGFCESDAATIEAQIIVSVDEMVNSLQKQMDRMNNRYDKPETQDSEIQNTEFADHIEAAETGACKGGKFRDKSCSCDCNLLEGVPGANYNEPGCTNKVLSQLGTIMTNGMNQAASVGRGVASTPAIITCMCARQSSSDLTNNHNKPHLPLDARGCTNRECHCIMSKGCRHCERALKMQEQIELQDELPATPNKSPKKNNASQNIECLADVDGDYVDEYLELLELDEAGTQTEYTDLYFGAPEPPAPEPNPCTCLTSVEIPWDMILVPPTPRKRPPPEEVILETIPETIRAQLKLLTVGPMTDEQLFELTKEFLRDQIATADDIEEIRKQIMAEKDRIDAQVAAAMAEEEDAPEEVEEEEKEKPIVRCRPRPTPKAFQVFDPETERYNEPYMDRMYKYICEDDEYGEAEECTSRVEMPWKQIEISKTVRIRKGKRPCDPRVITSSRDPQRKCGPEYRENIKRQREMFALDTPKLSDRPNSCDIRISFPNINSSLIQCICAPSNSASQPEMPLRKGVSETCICPGSSNKIKADTRSSKMHTPEIRDKPCITLPPFAKTSKTCGSGSIGGRTAASRNDRIAALLDSCKREMEPIKDGINQLRARIKELNLPDLVAYQEPPQHPGPASAGLNMMGSMLGPDMYGMQMPPMCYPPPMMCYPFPPCMFPPAPPPVNMAPGMTPMQPTRTPTSTSSKKACKCKSKHTKRQTSSSYNTSSGTESPSSDDETRRRHSRHKTPSNEKSCPRNKTKQRMPSDVSSSTKPSSTKLICACGTSTSIPPNESTVKELTNNSQLSVCGCASEKSKSYGKAKPSKIPRRVSQTSAQKSGTICPCSSLATPKMSSTRSCVSSQSQKDIASKSSLLLVQSCGTQFVNTPKTNSGIQVIKTASEVDKTRSTTNKGCLSNKDATATSTCKIRFSESSSKCKCKTCYRAKYKPTATSVGAEVKDGRPVDDIESTSSQCNTRND